MSDDSRHTRRTVLAVGAATLAGAAATTPAAAVPPLSVSTGSATNVDSTSATLNGYLDDLGPNDYANVRFEWGEYGTGLTERAGFEFRHAPGSFSATISGLNPNTPYDFRAVASADINQYDEGDTITFLTD